MLLLIEVWSLKRLASLLPQEVTAAWLLVQAKNFGLELLDLTVLKLKRRSQNSDHLMCSWHLQPWGLYPPQ